MKTDLDQTWIRIPFRGVVSKKLQWTLFACADGIGFFVAEIRFHILPRAKKILTVMLFSSNDDGRQEPSFVAVSRQAQQKQSPAEAVSEELQSLALPKFDEQPSDKKYTYAWAVGRITELEKSGITDPVSYFNNEMTDWWLAPDGMMEDDADFVGIAHAIEERWHI